MPYLTGLAHLATVTPDGRPHVSVVAPAIDVETVWIGTNRSSRTARNLAAGSSAALVWRPGAEVYVHAGVDLVDDVDTKRRVCDGGIFPYDPAMFFGSIDAPDFVLVRLAPTAATIMGMNAHGPSRRTWRSDTGPTGRHSPERPV